MKIIFFGSDDFALTHLLALAKSKHQVIACVTQPDKPKGRGLQVVSSPIKDWALQQNVPVLQPIDIKDSQLSMQLKAFNCEIFVVIAYGRILPPELLSIPSVMAVNVHGSLLPEYRGAAPINWAVINGDDVTGLSIIQMNPKMDDGDILTQAKIKIEPQDTSVTLRSKMMNLGAQLLLETIEQIDSKEYKALKQDLSKVTIAPKLTKELGHIHWNKTAIKIHNLVRGLKPWPGAYTFLKGKSLKIIESEVVKQDVSKSQPGEIVSIGSQGLVVATSQDALLIKEVHLEASKPMDAVSFARGARLEVGYKFD